MQISAVGIGTHVKIIFEPPFKTRQNPYGQIGLKLLRIYGEPDGYHTGGGLVTSVISSTKDSVDAVRLELGVPLRHLS